MNRQLVGVLETEKQWTKNDTRNRRSSVVVFQQDKPNPGSLAICQYMSDA